jgi:small-conductance mechanosensitive channel
VNQIEERKQEISNKDNEIKDLDDQIAQMERHLSHETKIAKPVKQTVRTYKVQRGDEVDEMLAQYINNMPFDLPISRLGGGQYMFGSKKIFAKVMNKKLVVRVGGGYMSMDEFIQTYAESERLKLLHMDPEEIERLHSSGTEKRVINTAEILAHRRANSPKYHAMGSLKSPRNGSGSDRKPIGK